MSQIKPGVQTSEFKLARHAIAALLGLFVIMGFIVEEQVVFYQQHLEAVFQSVAAIVVGYSASRGISKHGAERK
jgi:hypothetical protein